MQKPRIHKTRIGIFIPFVITLLLIAPSISSMQVLINTKFIEFENEICTSLTQRRLVLQTPLSIMEEKEFQIHVKNSNDDPAQ